MWALLKSLFVNWALFRVLLRCFGSLAFLVPLAVILKAIGWPVLIVLALLAILIVLVLLVVGLPILLVLVIGGMLLAVLAGVLTVGLVALKIIVPIMLALFLARWLFGKLTRDR